MSNDQDLSGGSGEDGDLPPLPARPFTTEENNIRINELKLNSSRKQSVFAVVSAIMLVMYMSAVFFAFCTLYVINSKGNNYDKIDWHAWIVVLTLVTPPTVLGVFLIKSIYSGKKQNVDDSSGVPVLDALNSLASSLKEILDLILKR